MLAALLEAREVCTFLEEVLVGPIEVFESVLQGMHRGILQPRSFVAVAPCGELFGQRHIADVLATRFTGFLLQCQRLVEDESRHAGELPQLALLLAGWLDAELVGLASEHRNTVYLYSHEYRAASRPALFFLDLKFEVCRATDQPELEWVCGVHSYS
ncbi:hypothetical protein D3C78_1483240 [compost metagenome]